MTCDERKSAGCEPTDCAAPGVFVTFEGGEGAGKSTHIRILAEALRAAGREVVCLCEPGGTAIGEQLRGVVLDPANDRMADMCELFIYEAARAQLVAEVIKPALERGAIVLSDRFADSTVAYQAHGRGIDEDAVRRANAIACQGVSPDRTILLEPPSAESGLSRAATVAAADRLEQAGASFHATVIAAFRAMADADPARIRRIVTAGSVEQTARLVYGEVADVFPFLSAEALDASARAVALDLAEGGEC